MHGVEVEGAIVILDEAHNIVSMSCDVSHDQPKSTVAARTFRVL